jgi:DNA polymerase III, subunit gamma and tau
MEKFIVSARKYRPDNFETLIGQDSIAITLKNSIKRGQLAHAYLFCGPRGVGKTSTARIFAKTINCLNPSKDLEPCGECESCKSFANGTSYCIHELDAASNNSVDDIRLLIEKVRIPPQIGKYSVYIIDEVHMLSTSAFNAFLKTLEEPPAYAIFILATTEKHKILPTVLSRCQTYDFNRISISDIVKQLNKIAEQENVKADEASLHVIAQKADGAMRDALTLFDQAIAFCGNKIDYETVIKNLNVLDNEYYFNITEAFLRGDYYRALIIFDEILSKGFNALYFVSGLSSHLRNLLICKDDISMKLLETSPALIEKYKAQSGKTSFKFLYTAIGETVKCESEYRLSSNQRLLVEFLLVKLSQINRDIQTVQEQNPQENSPQGQLHSKQLTPSEQNQQEQNTQVINETNSKPKENSEPNLNPLSIKNIMKKVSSSNTIKNEAEITENKEVTYDMLLQAWDKMGKSQKSYPRLGTAIAQSQPVFMEDNQTIIFIVGNSAQKDWIEKNSLIQLQDFLQKELSNNSLKLIIKIKEKTAEEKKPYMPEEKANFLIKNNSELNELRKDLDLEIK